MMFFITLKSRKILATWNDSDTENDRDDPFIHFWSWYVYLPLNMIIFAIKLCFLKEFDKFFNLNKIHIK